MPQSPPSRSNVGNLKRAAWQALQRRWPFTKVLDPIRDADPAGREMSHLPFTPFCRELDTTVVLHALKAGRYKGERATLVVLTLHFPGLQKTGQFCLEPQVRAVDRPHVTHPDSGANGPAFASYGPSFVFQPPTKKSLEAPQWSEMAWISSRLVPKPRNR